MPATIMGLAMVIGIAIFSFTWKGVKSENQTINVTGSAKRTIVSDLGILRLSINVDEVSQLAAYQSLKSKMPSLVNYLESKGFSKNKMTYQLANIFPNYLYNDSGDQVGIRSFGGTQTIEVQSSDVNLIKNTSLDAVSLVERGLSISVQTPEYYYTKLSDIKVDIQADAAKDAMVRGRRIAEATGRSLGVLTNARMGVLQITPENSNVTSDYGVNDVSSIRKEITAVINANFLIK
ncbi:MAG: SIMPL domain-containing protein [Sphingobacteriaceae bacterium]